MEGLGINAVQFGAQLINVLVLLFVLKKFLYKPLNSLLESRQKEIADGIASSDNAIALEKKLLEREKELEKKAKNLEQEVMSSVAKKAKVQADKIIKDAQEEAKKIAEKAQKQAKETLAQANEERKTEIAREAAKIANEALAKLLDSETSAKINEAQIKKLLS